MSYFTRQDLEDRVSAIVVQRIFDDNNDGQTDTSPVTRFIADCTSEVDSFLRPIYKLPLPTPPPNEVKRLALDVAEYRAARRFPEMLRKDWMELRKVTHEDLNNLRKGVTRLDVPTGADEQPANVGGEIDTTTAQSSAGVERAFVSVLEDMGDF